MKIMETGFVDSPEYGVTSQADKDFDFGNYIQDDEENVTPDYIPTYPQENQTYVKNKKDQPRRGSNSVEALVRHFKMFFPKSKRSSKHATYSTQPQVVERQTNGLRSFSFADSKIGKEFENFTMGHTADFFPFTTGYTEERDKTETAEPGHYNHRSRIIGEGNIFGSNPVENGLETAGVNHSRALEQQEELPLLSPRQTPSLASSSENDYLFPNGVSSDSIHLSDYANAPSLEHAQETAADSLQSPHSKEYSSFTGEISDYKEVGIHSNRESSEHNHDGVDPYRTSPMFDDGPVEETAYDRRSSVSESNEIFRSNEEQNVRREPMGTKHKSMSSLVDSPPPLLPIDPYRPIYQEEKLKVFRSAPHTDNEKSSNSSRSKSPHFVGKALRRISSYFSLKKDKSLQIEPDGGQTMDRF